ncbi:MAG TPA: hypothetical protein VGM69_11190 [Chloroflexota bacterium]
MGCYAVAEYRLWPGGTQPFLARAHEVSEALGLASGGGGLRVVIGDQDETQALWIARWDGPAAPGAADARLPAELRATLAASVASGVGEPWRWYASLRTLERVLAPATFCAAVRLRVAPEDGDRLVESWLTPALSHVTSHPELASIAALRALDDPGAFIALLEWRAPVGPQLWRELLRLVPPPVPLLSWDRLVGRIGQTRDRHAAMERPTLVHA